MMDEHLVNGPIKIKGMENIDRNFNQNRLIGQQPSSRTSGVPWGLSTIPRWSKMLLNIGQICGVKYKGPTSPWHDGAREGVRGGLNTLGYSAMKRDQKKLQKRQ